MNVSKIVRDIAVFLIIFFVGVILHFSIFSNIKIGVVAPNVLLILTCAFGFMRGGIHGMSFGFLAGLMVDCYSPDYFGLNCLIYLLVGFLNGLMTRFYFGDDVRLPILLIGVGEVFYGVFVYIAMFLIRQRFDFGFYFMNIIMPEAVYGILVFLLLYIPLLKAFKWAKSDNSKRIIR